MTSSSSELRHRHRHQASSQSSVGETSSGLMHDSSSYSDAGPFPRKETFTELPVLQENGQPATETTEIPTKTTSSHEVLQRSGTASSSGSGSVISNCETPAGSSTTGNKTQAQVAKAEGKVRRIATRVTSGALMIALFLGLVYMGHLYICMLVALTELLLVRTFVFILFYFIIYLFLKFR